MKVRYFQTVVHNLASIKFTYLPEEKIKFQFRNYIRATVNALLIGHVTPLLWTLQ